MEREQVEEAFALDGLGPVFAAFGMAIPEGNHARAGSSGFVQRRPRADAKTGGAYWSVPSESLLAACFTPVSPAVRAGVSHI